MDCVTCCDIRWVTQAKVQYTDSRKKPEVACKRGLIALSVNSKQHGERADGQEQVELSPEDFHSANVSVE